ncbi:Cupredoxin superfamily protein [Perilla frutescens var. frutescens]|nr:Cupredoxin superfamily protein [Perilla frutescens var. frutescens]
MAAKCRGADLAVVVVVATSIFGISTANKDWSTIAGNWNHSIPPPPPAAFWGLNATTHAQPPHSSKKIIVGGSENWHFGFNYTNWAINTGPFFLNDTLVFKYDPPNDTTFPHSVYMLPDFWSFQKCDLKRAKKIGEVNEGGGDGFQFVLKRWQPYYFACGEHDGIHCKLGLMKFAVWPLVRWTYSDHQ